MRALINARQRVCECVECPPNFSLHISPTGWRARCMYYISVGIMPCHRCDILYTLYNMSIRLGGEEGGIKKYLHYM